jgi:hypothetical protein
MRQHDSRTAIAKDANPNVTMAPVGQAFDPDAVSKIGGEPENDGNDVQCAPRLVQRR